MDPMAPATRLLPMLCFAGVGILISLAIGAVILRGAVSIINLIFGGENSAYGIPAPGFGWAMVIVLVAGIVSYVINFGMLFGLGYLQNAQPNLLGSLGTYPPQLVAGALSIPVNFLINSLLNALMLPTGLGRGLLVTIFQYIIIAVILGVVYGVLLAMGMGMMVNR